MKAIETDELKNLKDGQVININFKEMGISDVYPTGLRHSGNGHNVAIFND